MSTATLERVALPDGFTETAYAESTRQNLGWDRRYEATLQRGATAWRVCFMYSTKPLNERIVLDGEPFHRGVVHAYKSSGHRESFVHAEDAPLYVQKFIEQHIWQVAEFEQQRHGVRPMTEAEWREEEARKVAKQRAIEAAAERRRAAEIQGVARAIREVAQCGTTNSEAIAAWVLDMFIERAVVEDERAERQELLQEIAAERENEHAEIIEELNCAVDIAKRADAAIQAMAAAAVALEQPNATEFAYGSTDAEKALDVLSDGLWAIAEYQDNLSNGDIPEKREIK